MHYLRQTATALTVLIMLSNDSGDPDEDPYIGNVRLSNQPFFPSWCAAAGGLVEYLAQPIEDTTTFLVQLTSENNTADIFHLVYQQHGRLRIFCTVQAFITAAVLVTGVVTASAACRSNGQLPFLRRKAEPSRFVIHCVVIGATMVSILSNLVVMLGCHSKLSDGLQQLPSVYAKALADLKLYINETVLELYTELEEDEGAALKKFLSKALHVQLLRQEAPCSNRDGSFSLRVSSCLEGKVPAGPTGVLRESLEKQRTLALLGLEEMEMSVRAFEKRTRLWAHAQLIGLVVVPVMMVKLCAIVAFMGFGVGFGLRNYSSWSDPETNRVRYTGILMLANGVLILLFYVLGTPLLMILVATGLTGECYLCKPYRERSYYGLQAMSGVAWPYSARGELFAGLAPQQILTKCSGDGVSIVELDLQNDTEYYDGTIANALNDEALLSAERDFVDGNGTTVGTVTAGNCRPIYSILKTSMDVICGLCIQDILGVALSLALSMLTLLVVSPSVLTLSQYFFANEYDSSSENDRAENSEAELVSRAKKKSSGMMGRLLQSVFGAGSTFSGNPWHSRLAEIYREEGVDISDVISNAGSAPDASRVSSRKRRKSSAKNRRPTDHRVKKHAKEGKARRQPTTPSARASDGAPASGSRRGRSVPRMARLAAARYRDATTFLRPMP